MIPRNALFVSALLVAASASAQETLPFPGDVTLHDPAREVLDFFPRKTELEVLTTLDNVILTGFPLTDGTTVDLALYRNHIELNNYGFFVDGAPATYDPMDQTLWKGHIVGNDSSDVQLCLASYGCYGWIFDGGQYTHLTSFPGEVGGWANAGGRLYTERALLGAGGEMVDMNCAFDTLPENDRGERDMVLVDDGSSPAAGQQLLDLRMAVETDHQYYQNWGNIQACWTYTVNLLDAASDRYESQASVVLTYPYVQLHTNQNDPWNSQDNGGGCGDVLNEFKNAWDNGNIPMDAHLGHLISGANLGCGVAWLDVICSNSNGFAVSGNVNGGLDFPVNQGSNTWDFVVFVHETGHNCGANHTHAYCPPIDQCADNCTGSTQCSLGTNMSYCHGCGGMNNITTYFHPQIVNIIRNAAESSCIPNYDSRTEVTLFQDDFESGVMDPAWTTQRGKVRSAASYLSNWGMRIRKNGNATVVVDTTGFDGIKVYYNRRTANLDAGEDFRVRYKVGTGPWKTFDTVVTQHWGTIEHELPAEVDNKPSVSIRWKNYANEGKERGDIDNVMITGRQ